MKKVQIFCDGSCLGNPGNGGWAYILRYKEHEKKASGAKANTTNNQMELSAAINALKALKESCEVELFTDSSYQELWQELAKLLAFHKVKAQWVKGHAGHAENELCDQMARSEALSLK